MPEAGAVAVPAALTRFIGRVGWLLEDVVALPEPVGCKGMLGLWTIPTEVERAVARQLRRR